MSRSRWCRGPGRICWRRRPGARSIRARGIPNSWREYAFGRTGREAPEVMTEGSEPEFARFEAGYDPADPVDRAIFATRSAVFPEHGMMP